MLAMMADNIEHVITYWVLFQKFQSPMPAGFAVISHWTPFLLLSVYFERGDVLRSEHRDAHRPPERAHERGAERRHAEQDEPIPGAHGAAPATRST